MNEGYKQNKLINLKNDILSNLEMELDVLNAEE